MSGKLRRTLSLGLLLIAAGGVLAACGDDSDDSESQQLVFTSTEIAVEATDLGDKGSSQGDIRAFSQELFEEGSSEPAGRLDGAVAITDVEQAEGTPVEYRSGQIQFTLPDGNIVAVGNYVAEPGAAVPAEGGIDRAIVGGTGAYEGAQGTVTATAEGEDGFRYELDFETEGDD